MPGMHDLGHTFAVHGLEAWVRQGQDLRQRLPSFRATWGHAILKSTELYLQSVPGRFAKSLASLDGRTAPLSLPTFGSMSSFNLVEDNALNQRLAARLLEKGGHKRDGSRERLRPLRITL
jgi:hypothetical protein